MATWIKADGTEGDVLPKTGKAFTLSEIQEYVGGYFTPINLGEGYSMLVNEDGIPLHLPLNEQASRVAMQVILGDVLICKKKEWE